MQQHYHRPEKSGSDTIKGVETRRWKWKHSYTVIIYNLGLLGFVIVSFAITYCFCFRFVGVVAMVVRCGLHEVVVGFAVVDGGVVVTMIFFFPAGCVVTVVIVAGRGNGWLWLW